MIKIAAFFGFTAVLLGAFGAHALKATLLSMGTESTWKTASLYHLSHAIVLLVIALAAPQMRKAFAFFTIGLLLFSGSLYLLSLYSLPWLGPITPLGGLLLMGGWITLFFKK